MPEANVYSFATKEVLELLIKSAGVHEGRWVFGTNFNLSPGNFGPSNDQMSPGVVIAIAQVVIQRAEPQTPVEMTLDAAVVNPAPAGKKA